MHFLFTIAQLTFVIDGLKSLTEQSFSLKNLKPEYFGLLVLVLFSPLAWARKIETFKVGYVFGFCMILITMITVMAFCSSKLIHLSNDPNDKLNLR
jgi:amino acid permease